MKQQAVARLPRLYDADGDLSRDWQVQYYYRDPQTGKFKRFRIMNGLSKIRPELLRVMTEKQKKDLRDERYAVAAKIIAEMKGKLKRGFNPFKEHDMVFLEDVESGKQRRSAKSIESYLQEAAHIRMSGRAAGSVKNYRRFLENFINYLKAKKLDQLPITALDHRHAERFLTDIISGQGNSNKWRNEHLSYLRMCWNELMRLYPNRITTNPFALSQKVKHTRRKSPVYQTELREKIKRLLPDYDPQLWLFIQFVYYTGLRPGVELRAVQLKMLDITQGTLHIPAEKTKDKSDRMITLPKQLLDQLRKMKLGRMSGEWYLFTNDCKPGPKIMHESFHTRQWRAFKLKHNIPAEFKIYSFKHTGATAADKSGIDRREIQQQLGHNSLQQTEEYLEEWENKISEDIRNNFPTF